MAASHTNGGGTPVGVMASASIYACKFLDRCVRRMRSFVATEPGELTVCMRCCLRDTTAPVVVTHRMRSHASTMQLPRACPCCPTGEGTHAQE